MVHTVRFSLVFGCVPWFCHLSVSDVRRSKKQLHWVSMLKFFKTIDIFLHTCGVGEVGLTLFTHCMPRGIMKETKAKDIMGFWILDRNVNPTSQHQP